MQETVQETVHETVHETASAWDRHVDTYDRLFSPLTGYIAKAMIELVRPHLRRPSRLLDIAFGTGALTVPAVAATLQAPGPGGTIGSVTALDLSRGMVEHTRRAGRALAEGLGADGELLQVDVGDGQSLPYEDATFDAVFSCFGIFLFEDRRAGWAEAARVTAPGGHFVTSVWRGPEHNMMLRAQIAPLMASLPERLRPAKARGWIEVAEAPALLAEIAAAAPDLIDLRCYPFAASIVLPSPKATFEAMLDNPVVGRLLRECTPEELATVERATIASFTAHAGGAERPLVLDAACHIVVATRA